MDLINIQASSYAPQIDNLLIIITVLVGFWFLVAEGVLFWLIFKFKKKSTTKAKYITGEKKSEMKWIHWPHNLIIICDVVILYFAVVAWYNVKQELPPAQDSITVTGQQWSWSFVHSGVDKKLNTQDDIEVVDELHVIINKTYHYFLKSKDVMHSFAIPTFRLKQDAVPGRTITGWFKPTKLGIFDIQCAEICGIGHGIMGGRIIVQTEEDYNKWLAQQKPIGRIAKSTIN